MQPRQHGGEDVGGGHPDGGHPVLDELQRHGGEELPDVGGAVQVEAHHTPQLLSHLEPEPPVALIVHLEELLDKSLAW